MELKFKYKTIIYILTSMAILLSASILTSLMGIGELADELLDINYFDMLLGEIANTLIVLSLTSLLSENFGQAYWVDIKETKLIAPFWSCFTGITVYLLTSMVYSVVAYVLNFKTGVVVSAVYSTVLLIVLTFKMINIYFGKDELKRKLGAEYKKLLILYNSSYVEDYLRRLKNYLDVVVNEKFPHKNKFVANLKKEIKTIEEQLNSQNESIINACHKSHIDKYVNEKSRLQDIDMKLCEYTKNAIINNDSEVVRENIELLVECENYNTFFDLLEDLFDWDEKYACRTLYDLSQKNKAWVIKDRMNFFKQYALSKLISSSAKLDALDNLLMIYDATNLGMKQLGDDIKMITNENTSLKEREIQLEKELTEAKDLRECMKRQRAERKEITEGYNALSERLLTILNSASAKDLRSFYIPIREANIAYDEGKYDIVNKYLTVILTNFEQDKLTIKHESGITKLNSPIQFEFSYLTEDEKLLLDKLIEKDKTRMSIPENTKNRLLTLDKVIITNDSGEDINGDLLDIFKSTLN
jgi:hypothetical protein